jgi:hypothetical protein
MLSSPTNITFFGNPSKHPRPIIKFLKRYHFHVHLTPKIPWDQKLVDTCLGSLYKEIFFFQFFLLDKWTTCFTSFPWISSTSNSNSVWACGEVLFKTGIKLIFPVFYEELLHAAMWLILPKGWRAGC